MTLMKRVLGVVIIVIGVVISLISVVSVSKNFRDNPEQGVHLAESITGLLIFASLWIPACIFIIRLGVKWIKAS